MRPNRLLESPETRERFAAAGIRSGSGNPEGFATFVRELCKAVDKLTGA
jgi:hypothetical protein